MSLDEIKNLNIKEKIILINAVWESLDGEDQNIESPNWHENIIKERAAKIHRNKATYISLEELKHR